MSRRINSSFCILLITLRSLSLSAGTRVSAEDFDYGPLITRDITLDGKIRTRVLGPLWEKQSDGAEKSLSALRPVFAMVTDDGIPRCLKEVIWPIATFKSRKDEYFWRVITGFGLDFDTENPSRYKNHIYPFLFQGKAADGSSYFAVFPLGGKIKQILGRDSVSFVLFPLYARTQVNEAVTYDVLWPVISWGSHDEGDRWRVFPFYGQAEHYGHWKRKFVMWPIWTSVDYEKEDAGGFLLFPITGYSRIADERTYWMIPPFFKWLESDDRRVVNAPWPFFQYERSDEKDKTYLWPLFGKKRFGTKDSAFFLWPIFLTSKQVRGEETDSRFYALPFVYSDKTVERVEGEDGDEAVAEVTSRYFKLWPLFSYQREGDVSRFRSLELWPVKHTAPVERNFAPFWTIYTRERSGDSSDTELLWGMYRNRRGADGERAFSVFPLYSRRSMADADEFSSWNLLAGIFGREVKDGIRKWRVLYFFRFGNRNVAEK